jgi:Na+-translocating ferredoxin:NAD+ oxidoreductase subunit G
LKDAIKMIGATAIFCLVAGLLLAWTNKITKDPIEKAQRMELINGLRRVLPECDNDLLADAKTVEDNGAKWTFYPGRKDGKCVGVAFRTSSGKGYGGLIQVLVGVLPDGTINKLEIGENKETPGLGTKVKNESFTKQFIGKSASDTRWAAVKKDGGEIQAITGATISSRAVSDAVKTGLDVFARHSKEVLE